MLSEKNNEEIAGASVYFNNTSIGTSTNSRGDFSFRASELFNAELIISCVGYEPLVYKIPQDADLSKLYTFKLAEKEALMQDVLVLSKDMRKKYLEKFRKNFLGQTQEAASSRILNEDAIYFTKSDTEKESFNAFADTPLVITNKMLGYRISFELQDFYYSSAKTLFFGFTRYEEMGDKKRYIKNRKKAYYGSTMHFFRALINDNLAAASYQLFQMKDDSLKVKRENDPAHFTIKKVTTAYPVTPAQIISKDSSGNFYRAVFKNKLMIQYGKNPASKTWLSQHVFLSENLPVGFRSYLQLSEGEVEMLIDKDGLIQNPMNVLFGGYWIYEKAANLLPFNYHPEKDQ